MFAQPPPIKQGCTVGLQTTGVHPSSPSPRWKGIKRHKGRLPPGAYTLGLDSPVPWPFLLPPPGSCSGVMVALSGRNLPISHPAHELLADGTTESSPVARSGGVLQPDTGGTPSPYLWAEDGGRAITLGRAVRTTSPRLASTIMFWSVFSSTSSSRFPNAGSLESPEVQAGDV